MTKIKNTNAYPFDVNITDDDYLIGSDGDTQEKQTKNYPIGLVRDYILSGLSPLEGGTLRIVEFIDDSVSGYETPEEFLNDSSPVKNIEQYHVAITTLKNGEKYLLKKQDVIVGQGQTPLLSTDFILLDAKVNVGAGTAVIKGINETTGKTEFRTINKSGNLVTITLGNSDQEVVVSINETNLATFVKANQKNFTVSNVGTGLELYKNTTVTETLNTFNFIKVGTSTLNARLSEDGNTLLIDTPETSTIPALYVNNLHVLTEKEWIQNGSVPYRGEGTLARPFTDTITGYVSGAPTIVPNTAIQNALDGHPTLSYVSPGLLGTRLNPNRQGEKIIVQDNNSTYIFAGDFSYSSLNIEFQCNVGCTTTGWLVDMDNTSYFDATFSVFTITINEGILFEFTQSLGFRNSGNTSSTPPSFDTGREGVFLGEGTIYTGYNGVNVLTRYIFNGDGNNNDDNLHFQVKCKVRADFQGIYLTKNKMRIDFYNTIQSGIFLGSINTSLQAFRMEGGQVRFYEKGAVSINGNTTGRNYGFTFEPTGLGIGNTSFQLNSAKVTGNMNYCFAKLNNENVEFLAFNSPSGDNFTTTLPGTSTLVDGLFENLGASKWNVNFKNNVFSFTGIDFSKVDLTQGNNVSSVNFIGSNVVESLVVKSSKSQAKLDGLPNNSKFLKRKTFNAGSFVVGQEYRITSLGTTNFTLIGAASNTVGLWFTASGVGTGNGTASTESIEIV